MAGLWESQTVPNRLDTPVPPPRHPCRMAEIKQKIMINSKKMAEIKQKIMINSKKSVRIHTLCQHLMEEQEEVLKSVSPKTRSQGLTCSGCISSSFKSGHFGIT